MGNLISQYNPLSVYGEYNLREKIYKNKRVVIFTLSFILIIIIGAIVMVFSSSLDSNPPLVKKYDFPPPRYGNGPYGYGVYMPPANIISALL